MGAHGAVKWLQRAVCAVTRRGQMYAVYGFCLEKMRRK